MKIQLELSDALIDKVIRGIMENFPEASQGCALACEAYDYNAMRFKFKDMEEPKRYVLFDTQFREAFALMFTDKWPKGCTKPPLSNDPEVWDEWLGQADAQDFDAFVQLACLGEVIYG